MARLRVNQIDFLQVTDVSIDTPSSLMSPRFSHFMSKWNDCLKSQNGHRHQFNYRISFNRSSMNTINFSWRTIKFFTIEMPFDNVVKSNFNNRTNLNASSILKSMIKTVDHRAEECKDIIETFVFVIPLVHSNGPQLLVSKPNTNAIFERRLVCENIKGTYEACTKCLYPSMIRQRIFFPDRKLIQFDSGKLNALSELLRERKLGNHKCLIFTQMSKMLDILEAFLNLYGYTYVRLDGSTGVDKRQKLMDRFNNDPKLFIFILSTRSGGLGINLTGADTVIFYDR